MGKLPWVKYYYADIEQDTKGLTPTALGGWDRILHQMWHRQDKTFKLFDGTLSGDYRYWNNIIGCTTIETKKILHELINQKICYYHFSQRNNNGIITVGCRRIMREQKAKENNRLRQEKYNTNRNITDNLQPHNAIEAKKSLEAKNTDTNIKKKTSKKESLILPDWINQELWAELLAHRKRRKAPNSDRALQAIINNISRLMQEGHKPDDLLEKILERGWVTIEKSWLQIYNQQSSAADDGNSIEDYKRRKAEQALL